MRGKIQRQRVCEGDNEQERGGVRGEGGGGGWGGERKRERERRTQIYI